MNAGQLDRRITIQQRSTNVDATGGQSSVWVDQFTVWARIWALSTRELFAAQAVSSEISHKITVRYRPELANPLTAATLRGVYNGRYFNFQGVTNLGERNQTLEISAVEGLNNG